MKKNYAIFTAIFGGYDSLPEINEKFIADRFDFICFTDQIIANSFPWKIFHISQLPEGPAVTNRQIKFNAHKYLSEYDYAMYIDGNIYLKYSPDYFFSFLKLSYGCVMLAHPNRKTVLEEIAVCVGFQKIKLYEAIHMLYLYVQVGYVERFNLTANRLIVRDLRNIKINNCFEEIYIKYLTGPRRDQLHSNFCMWRNNVNVLIMASEDYVDAFEVNSHLMMENKLNNFKGRIMYISVYMFLRLLKSLFEFLIFIMTKYGVR